MRLGRGSFVGVLAGSDGGKQHSGGEGELLHVGVKELASGVDPATLEGVTSDHQGVSVI